jgi:hypothetical protein
MTADFPILDSIVLIVTVLQCRHVTAIDCVSTGKPANGCIQKIFLRIVTHLREGTTGLEAPHDPEKKVAPRAALHLA